MAKSYQIDEYGLLIGLIATPEGMTIDDFFEKEIKTNLSELYKKDRFGENGEKTNLYTFKGYKTFGDHDLAVISLIDDFSYPNRVFQPAHGNRADTDTNFYNYDYQIMTCLNTIPGPNNTNLTLEKELWSTTKELSIDKYPYICITRAKLSNYFLLGNGISFIELVKRYLLSRNDFHNSGQNRMKTIVLDNMGCEEIVIINFSHSLSLMAEFNHEIRCSNFGKLKELDSKESQKILKNKFTADSSDEIVWNQTHIFTSYYSLPGYSMQGDCASLMTNAKENLMVYIDFNWDIKPGHATNFKKDFEQLLKSNFVNDREVLNREPLRLNNSSWLYKLSFKELESNRLFDIIEALRNFDYVKNHVRKLHMKMEICEAKEASATSLLETYCHEINAKQHPQTSSYSKKLKISPTDLKDLRTALQKANTSKLLRERIMKMYNNYNNCIVDPMFFANFIDLHGFMKSFKKRIENYANSNNTESSLFFHEWMNTQVISFEQAYYNRFHQSNRMKEMSDFNLEWNGGIQQIISPLDSAFKELLSHFGYTFDDKFVHVSGYERVQVTENTFRINMLHITYPELFASTIWKEIFNFFWRSAFSASDNIYFAKNNFHEYLKYSIEHRAEYERYNPVHRILLESIDKDFTNDFVADTLSFYYGYAGEFKDFSYWYWKYLFQTPLYYDKLQKIDQKIFLKFLTRILFVKMLEDEDGAEDMIYCPADPVLSELWVTNFKDVLSFVRILKTIFDWHEYKEKIEGMAINLMQKDIRQKNAERQTDAEIGHTEEIKKERKDQYLRGVVGFYKSFSEGVIPLIEDDESNFKLVQLFGAFLKYLMLIDKDDSTERKTQILTRSNEGTPDSLKSRECSSHILADSHGGVFCFDINIQKQCFMARSSFYRALFDLCMRNKKKQIDPQM